ncbi:aminopeptidase [Flavobacterium oreochromis]|uniref:Aminopeptidase n=1 Tax=Flavobacterium oreochromis TaxID=2906078 RepID=A0ABW8P8F2_9FLAO|nr:aminopeptidase [Flavobacterium oreochromis]OWP76904.1 aminopeptidase [Flavobacterium oreochromis]
MKQHFLIFIWLFTLNNVNRTYSQQSLDCKVVLEPHSQKLVVHQKIIYKNQYPYPINKLIFNDWNHSYSNRQTPLGKKLSDQFVRNFHLSNKNERGETFLNSIKVNNTIVSPLRIPDKIDLFSIDIPSLKPNDFVEIQLDYELKIPNSKFTRWGVNKDDFYLKDCFLLVNRQINSNTAVLYSNENTEDATYESIDEMIFSFELPNQYKISSNLDPIDSKTFKSKNLKEYQFIIEKDKTFETISNDNMTIVTNLDSKNINDIQKFLVIDRIINYFQKHLGKSKTNKLLISQVDYDRNPFYGLNQLPNILSPFPNSFLYELKFLKIYSQNFLKSNLNIDWRKDHYLLDAIQLYYLINYIEEYYPNINLAGTLNRFKILRGYELISAKFNEQYYHAYLMMARKTLDQALNTPKNNLSKFNEQIALKYKAGLIFKYLENYLEDQSLEKSIQEFITINHQQFCTSTDFEKILKKNAQKNIDWFFNELIPSKEFVDYHFGKIKNNNNQIELEIKKNQNSNIPFTLSGYKNKEKIFQKWIIPNFEKDTTLIFNRKELDQFIINENIFFPELNKKNNYKTTPFFKTNRPFRFTFFRDLEDSKRNQIFYYPNIDYNVYDGVLLSLIFNNESFIGRPFNYEISPSYSFNAQSFTGSGFVGYSLNKPSNHNFQTRFTLSSSYYHYIQNASYFRIIPALTFRFRNLDITKNEYKSLSFRHVFVNKEFSPLSKDTLSPLRYSVFNARYSFGNNETAKGYYVSNQIQIGNEFAKYISEISYRKLFENNYQIGFRFYGGLFLYKNTNSSYYDFGLDRPKDYLFDYSFYGRSEKSGFFSQQIIIAEGGFKSKFNNPYANQWLTALNITSSLWKWIQLYGDIGLYKNKYHDPNFVYDTGIHFNIVPDYFEIYCPIYSKNGWEIGQKNYTEKIRFQFTINPKTLLGIFNRKWF